MSTLKLHNNTIWVVVCVTFPDVKAWNVMHIVANRMCAESGLLPGRRGASRHGPPAHPWAGPGRRMPGPPRAPRWRGRRCRSWAPPWCAAAWSHPGPSPGSPAARTLRTDPCSPGGHLGGVSNTAARVWWSERWRPLLCSIMWWTDEPTVNSWKNR